MFTVETITSQSRRVDTYKAALDFIAREFPQHPRARFCETDEGPGCLYVYPDRATYDADGAPLACIQCTSDDPSGIPTDWDGVPVRMTTDVQP